MAKTNKTKKKVEEAPKVEPDPIEEQEDYNVGKRDEMPIIDQEIPEEPKKETQPEPEQPEEAKVEEYTDTELFEIPCKCIGCEATFTWKVPRGIGTPSLVFTECKNCRGF